MANNRSLASLVKTIQMVSSPHSAEVNPFIPGCEHSLFHLHRLGEP